NTARLRRFVGWVERSETQQSPENVGFRSSTQPTQECFFRLNRAVLERIPKRTKIRKKCLTQLY
ncbi:hypothetical protein, partial [Nostoc commune]|uniref:hypothetical protein n=1 Tax=Nostoc commune TaxID=1178 RepID=UPI001E3AE62E